MNIKWRDRNGNILSVNKEKLIYLDRDNGIKTPLRRDEIKKITMDDGLMNIFRDFDNDLILTIVIPKKRMRDAARIYNEYDKTGAMLKKVSSDFLLDLILESTVIVGNPLFGVLAILVPIAVIFNVVIYFLGEIGVVLARILIFGYLAYLAISYILLRIKRKKLKEI